MENALANVTEYPDSHLAKMFLRAQESSNFEDMETVPRSGEGLGKDRIRILYNMTVIKKVCYD